MSEKCGNNNNKNSDNTLTSRRTDEGKNIQLRFLLRLIVICITGVHTTVDTSGKKKTDTSMNNNQNIQTRVRYILPSVSATKKAIEIRGTSVIVTSFP